MTPVKIIIDTDIGDDVDDAIAIAWAMLRPELDIRAITTVFGPVEKRAQLVAKLLKLFGREDIAFAAGESRPLSMPDGDPRHAAMAREPNQYPLVVPGETLPAPAACGGEELLARTIDSHAGDIWLVTIGAMTNAARLIERRPATAAKLKGIACMAAETHLLRREYNIICDPEAARVCFRNGLVRYVGTWDVTRRVAMRPGDMDALEAAGTERSRALLKLTALWQPHQKWKPRPVMYDLCPLLWLFAPQVFKTEPMRLDVELAGTLTRGMAVPVSNGPEIAVTTGMDENAALQNLIDTLVAGCRADV